MPNQENFSIRQFLDGKWREIDLLEGVTQEEALMIAAGYVGDFNPLENQWQLVAIGFEEERLIA